MSDLPDCLQPALEQIEKYKSEIASLQSENKSLDENIQVLSSEKKALHTKVEADEATHASMVESYEKEKLTLRELNRVVSDQLREKIDELESLSKSQVELEEQNGYFKNLNSELTEQNTRVSSESLRVNADQEALSHQTDQLNATVEELQTQNARLKEENANLTLINSAMQQRQLQEKESSSNDSALLSQIEGLKQELSVYETGSTDISFLRSENARLIQRHGEITQEKMQASAKMHVTQNELQKTALELDTALKSLEQLEFEYQGLQNLHKNLSEERNSLVMDNGSLVDEKAQLEEKNLKLSELIQNVTTEKELAVRELNQEHIKADVMTEEVNHLRMKSRTLAEEIKALKEGMQDQDSLDSHVQVLEIEVPDESKTSQQNEVKIVSSSTNSGPHFPGELHKNEGNR